MKKTTIAKLALFLTAMLWGSTFAIGKLAAEVFSASFIIALRFSVAVPVLVIAAFPLRKQLNKAYLRDGFWMGVSLFASYILQVVGLTLDTSPGKSAFLCTTYSVMIPFIYWIVTKEKPKLLHVICVFICMTGVGVLSLHGGWGMTTGDLLTVLSGVPCAINMVQSAITCRDKNPLLLTTVELAVVAALAWVFVILDGSFPTTFPMATVGGIVYLGVFATALCLFMQTFGFKYAEASVGGMIISLESVFGVIFSMIIYHETVTLRMLLGFALIFVAIVAAQKE